MEVKRDLEDVDSETEVKRVKLDTSSDAAVNGNGTDAADAEEQKSDDVGGDVKEEETQNQEQVPSSGPQAQSESTQPTEEASKPSTQSQEPASESDLQQPPSSAPESEAQSTEVKSEEPKQEGPQQQQSSTLQNGSALPMTPAPKPPTEPDMNNLPENPIPKHQQQFGTRIIKIVKRMKDASPFLQPVDTVKLNIPLYYNFIPRPMDLSTIERKLQVNAYSEVQQFVDDFNLMVDNCIKFNGQDSAIAQMSRNIQASFEKHMLNMPTKDLPPNSKGSNGRKQSSTPGELNAEGVPTIRRDSTMNGGRPKREIHPPKPKDMPYDIRPRKKKFVAELRFSQQVLKELMSKKYESFNFPFMEPVDPVALNCPTYFEYIKEPMDFSTIQNKLNNNQYENADQFEKDIRLVFNNCYTFNPEGTAVNMMGHRLEEVFDKRWVDRPVAQQSPTQSDYEEFSEDEVSEEEEIDESMITSPAIQFLEGQLNRMKQDLAKLKKEELAKLRKERNSKKKKSKAKKRRRRQSSYDSSSASITYDMKKELSEKINDLPEKKLSQVLSIISEAMNIQNENGEEIELDMDQLDNSTLLRLYHLVVKKKNSSSSNPRRSSSGHNISSSRKKKNKNLSEAEQSRQIENIKKKLEQMNQPSSNGGSSQYDKSDDDSDEDDISSESSEEE